MNDKLRVLAVVSIYHALNDGTVTVVPLLYPIFRELYSLSYTQIGIITGSGLLVTLFAQLYFGRKADGKNFNTLLSLGVIITCASLLLLTKSFDFFSLLVLIILLRIGLSFFHPIGIAWISRIFKKERIDWAMGMQSGFADIGAFLGVATTLYIAEMTSWEFPLYLWALLGGIGLFAAFGFTRTLHPNVTSVSLVQQKQTIKEAILEGVHMGKNIKLLIPAFIVSGAAWGTTLTYLPLLLHERTSLPLSLIGILVAVWIGVGSIASFLYGKICARVKRKNVIILAYIAMGVTCLLLTFVLNVYALIVIMVVFGLATFLTYPALFSFVSEVTNEAIEGRTFGMIFTWQLAVVTTMLFISGFFSDLIGIWIPFAILGVFSAIVAVLLLFNYKKPFACF